MYYNFYPSSQSVEKIKKNSNNVKKPPEGFLWAVAVIDEDSTDPYTADLRRQFFNFGGVDLWGDIIGVGKKSLKAVKLLSEAAKDKGLNLLDVLTSDESLDSREIFGISNIKRAAEQLGVGIQTDEILKDLVEKSLELPSRLLKGGKGLLEALLPFGE